MTDRLLTRKQTRALVLGRLLASGSLFRPRLAADCRLSEASISRIVAELRDESMVEEVRRPAPYPGGPSQMVTLRKDQWVAGLDIANDRLTLGAGTFTGEIGYLERHELPAGASPASLAAVLDRAVGALAAWCAQQGVVPWRVAVSIPGLRGLAGPPNPIIAIDAAWLDAQLARAFPDVPIVFANAITAHAAAQLHGRGDAPIEERHLFVHLGHGVGGAWVEPLAMAGPIRPIEIGHVVLDAAGPRCRCGHHGCLEAVASTSALAALCEVPERQLIAAGDDWPTLTRLTPKRSAALREVLLRVGIAIGNALNVMPVSRVALSGWPTALPAPLRDAVAEGMDMSLFGGLAAAPVALRFLRTAIGTEPRAALAYAMHDLVCEGGLAPRAQQPGQRLAG